MKIVDEELTINYLYKSLDICLDTSYEKFLYKKLEENTEKEKIIGYTLTGPHRDDFEVAIGCKNYSIIFLVV